MNGTRTFLSILLIFLFHTGNVVAQKVNKPQVIVMTDGEIDDHCSMLRFLLYTCDLDVKAIIETNSKWQREGHSKEDWRENMLDAYEKVLPNLLVHNSDYPSADYLRSISYVGDEDPGHLDTPRSSYKPGQNKYRDPSGWKDTPGSEKILEVLLEESQEPVYIQVWGGANTLSRALYKLKEQYPERYKETTSRIVTYNIDYQDGAGTYIEQFHPYVTKIVSWGFVGSWNYKSQTDTYDLIEKEIKSNHGPLGALYPQKYVNEGDTPAFLYCLPNGLRNGENPTYGGWGGRFEPKQSDSSVFLDAFDGGSMKQSLTRWIKDINAGFMARMDWCVASDFKQANHAPELRINSEIDISVKSGEYFELNLEGSSDPDGDLIDFQWRVYQEAGTYKGKFEVKYQEGHTFKAVAPKVDQTETIHVIAEVSDFPSKGPSLKAYQRFIVKINPESIRLK